MGVLGSIPSLSMPPHPELLRQWEGTPQMEIFRERFQRARAYGVNEPFSFRWEGLRRDGVQQVTVQVICLLVDFEDQPANRQIYPPSHYQRMLFSEGAYRTGSMRDWYRENSYGEVEVVGEVYGWYRMPRRYAFYVNGQNGFGEYPQNAQGLVRDALLAADDDVNYNRFDNRGDGIVEALFVVHAGPGAEVTGSDDDIWSHAWFVPGNLSLDGVRFRRYAMVPEDGQIGVFGHELAHSFFGLPDLYDGTYRSAGLGRWSMMAAGSWGDGGRSPTHFDAWCKKRIGFLNPERLNQERRALTIRPVEYQPEVYLLWRWGEEIERQYFLIENRRRVGFDRSLPGNGLLVYHIDETMDGNRNPWIPGEGGELHYLVALEQADGRFDLERNSNSGDEGDPFPGITFNETFGDRTLPNSRDYGGNPTHITLDAIESTPNSEMRLDVYFDPNFTFPTMNLLILNHIPRDHRYPHPDARGDSTWTDELSLLSSLIGQLGVEGRVVPALPEDLSPYNTIIYLESWREENGESVPMTAEERVQLRQFLLDGGNLLLVGPDVATNLQGDTLLWPLLGAVYRGEGNPREIGNLRRLSSNPESRIVGQNFVYTFRGICDHYIDEVSDSSHYGNYLFTDQNRSFRGLMRRLENGGRVILQPFLFGGLIDWGGRKLFLLQRYFAYFRFRLTPLAVQIADRPLVPTLTHLTAYPNPFNHNLKVLWRGVEPGMELKVFDMQGRLISHLPLLAEAGMTLWVPQNLPSGTYWLGLNGP
ncbi:MAG: M6 family metalloprotease domain-containing protein, partial [bacterium]